VYDNGGRAYRPGYFPKKSRAMSTRTSHVLPRQPRPAIWVDSISILERLFGGNTVRGKKKSQL
jgi:hypothetical protein